MVRQSLSLRITRWRGVALAAALLVMMAIPVLHDPDSQPSSLASDALDGGVLLYVMPGFDASAADRLFRVFPDGSGSAEITFDQPLHIERALLSPDGRRLAIQSRDPGNVGRIYTGAIGSHILTPLPVDATHMGLEDWHPSGEDLLAWRFVDGQYDLIRLGLDGEITGLITTPGVDERGGRWSPDGAWVAFLAPGEGGAMDIYVQSVDSGEPFNLTKSPGDEQAAEWSPDGRRLLYRGGDRLVVAGLDGERLGDIPAFPAAMAYGWSPAGEIWLADDSGAVYSGRASGAPLEPLISLGEGQQLVDWGMAGAPPLVVTPGQIALAAEEGVAHAESFTVRVGSGDLLETRWEAATTAEWLTVEADAGETPSEGEITVDTTRLPAGLHQAEVTFQPGDVRLPVSVAVNPAGAGAQLAVAPGALAIHGVAGGPAPPAVRLEIGSAGEPVNWLASAPDAPWLRLEPGGGVTPAALTVGVDTSGLTTGRYEAAITLLPGDVQIPVTLDLIEPAPQARLNASPELLTFVAVTGEDAPEPKRLALTRPDGSEAAWHAVTSAPWLRLSAYSGTTPEEVGVSVDPQGLEPGEHSGSIWVGQRSIPVRLTVLDPPAQAAGDPTPTPAVEPTTEPAPDPAPRSADQPEATPAAPDPPGLHVQPAAIRIAAIAGGPGAGDREIEISALGAGPASWSITVSEPWLHVDSEAGSTPATVNLSADISGLAPGVHQAELRVGDLSIPVELILLEAAEAEEEFQKTWAYQDKPVDDAVAPRTWLWGPAPNGTTYEAFAESPGGQRVVQYYDKSRMEITYPAADRDSEWYVTNGLLARELITGRLQLGETTFEPHDPADIPVAGDASDVNGPRYSSFTGLLDAPALPAGSIVTQTVDAGGNVGDNPAFASYGVTVTGPNSTTGHSIAQVFWEYLTSSGQVQGDLGYITGPLFEPWFYATGLPITEPYWAVVEVGGTPHDVLIQCFERRCLTFTPENQPPWQVEQGNVGLHYFRWRYEQLHRE